MSSNHKSERLNNKSVKLDIKSVQRVQLITGI